LKRFLTNISIELKETEILVLNRGFLIRRSLRLKQWFIGHRPKAPPQFDPDTARL
jgi:hypothetical protein